MTHLNSLVHVEPQVFFSESSVAQTLSDTKLLLGSVWSSDFTDNTVFVLHALHGKNVPHEI